MKKILLIIVLVFTAILITNGCSNNYVKYQPNGEVEIGRQTLFVNSKWGLAKITIDPNGVMIIGENLIFDPEKIKVITPYGILETE